MIFSSYILVLWRIMRTNSIIMIFLILEINILLFLILCLSIENKSWLNFNTVDYMFYYFLIQNIISMIFLIVAIRDPFRGNFVFHRSSVLTILILMKIGIYPFSFWVYKISRKMNRYSFIILMTFQKIPIFPLIEVISREIILYILILNIFIGSIFIMVRNNLIYLIIRSSIYRFLWIYIFFINSVEISLCYYFIYTIILILALKKEFKSRKLLRLMVLLMFRLNNPPLGSFFLKFNLLSDIILVPLLVKVVLVIGITFSLFSYFKFLIVYCFKDIFLYNKKLRIINRTVLMRILSSFVYFL